MAKTYESIATTTLGSDSATVSFTSISGSYTDIVLIVDAVRTGSNNVAWIRVNSDTGSNYSFTTLQGNGTAASSYRESNSTAPWVTPEIWAQNARGNLIINFQNYSNTTTYKTFLTRYNLAAQGTGSIVGLWRNTAAISTILLSPGSGNWAAGSTFTLYGIKKAA